MPANLALVRLTAAVYFIQGALGLSGVAFPLFLREGGLGIDDIASFSSIVSLPWLIKPFLAALSDALPLWGYRRKSYLILCSFLSMLGWWALAVSSSHVLIIAVCMIVANAGFSATDVVTDGLIVEHSTKETVQAYQSISWGFRSAGAIVSGVVGGWLVNVIGYRMIFALTGLLPILSLIFAFRLREDPVHRESSERAASFLSILKPIFESVRLILKGNVRWFALLLVIITSSASFATPLFFYMRDHLKFSETMLGTLSSVRWVGAVLGCFLYYRFMGQVSLKKALVIAVAVEVLSTLLCLFIFGQTSAWVVGIVTGVTAYITLLPLLAASAAFSRGTGLESSLFAILMSIYNAGMVLFTYLGGMLYRVAGLPVLILLSACVSAAGLILIKKLN